MLTLTPVLQVHSPTTPAYIRTLPFETASAPTHYLLLTGDTFGGTHPVVMLLDTYNPVLSYGDEGEEDHLVFFTSSDTEAQELRRQIHARLQCLSWHYKLKLWWRRQLPSRFLLKRLPPT